MENQNHLLVGMRALQPQKKSGGFPGKTEERNPSIGNNLAVAELTSCVLMELYDLDENDEYKNWSFNYIKGYVENKTKEQTGAVCLRITKRVGACLDLILEKPTKLEGKTK